MDDSIARCSKCREWKAKTDFSKDKNNKSGVASWCKKCANEHMKKRYASDPNAKQKAREKYAANPEKYKEAVRRHKAKFPEKVRESYQKWLNKNTEQERKRSQRRHALNREKDREQSRKWRIANREKARELKRRWYSKYTKKIAEYKKAWYQKNIEKVLQSAKEKKRDRRARIIGSGGKITNKEWKDLCEKYGNKCIAPGCQRLDITMDHVVPLSRGGPHSIDNVQPLCDHHNKSKGTRTIDYRKVL